MSEQHGMLDEQQLTTLKDLPIAAGGPDAEALPRPSHDHNQHNHHNGAAPVKSHIKHTTDTENGGKLTQWRVWHHIHRVLILVCAILYIAKCTQATSETFDLLVGKAVSPAASPPFTLPNLAEAIGTTTLRENPLVQTMLQGDTTPRNGTLFLTVTGYAFAPCPALSPLTARIYNNAFLRSLYTALVSQVNYELTFLHSDEIELVLPVVDCANPFIEFAYGTAGSFSFVVRNRYGDHVSMLSVMLSNQDYKILSQTGEGPAAVATLTFISNLRASDNAPVDHHFVISLGYPFEQFDFRAASYLSTTEYGSWRLRVIPATDRKEVYKVVETASRSGFYIKAITEQSNVNAYIWNLPSDPIGAVATSQASIKTGLRNSWAWVHLLQLLLIYRHFYPDLIHVQHSRLGIGTSAVSGNEEALLALEQKLTIFELATGAELQRCFEFLSDYENCKFIKGVKHASADGVYGNGFVIANSKFLMQTEDFWAIVIMKVLRVRYQNIYVYELEGTTVKQTARLVYPQTLTWTDLFSLGITTPS